jgi:hypothetical protein
MVAALQNDFARLHRLRIAADKNDTGECSTDFEGRVGVVDALPRIAA